jgi:AP2 domain/HNH endonuclease
MLTRRVPVKIAKKAWTSTLIDAVDYSWASQFVWYLVNGYAYRYERRDGKQVWFLMHREITGVSQGVQVDHKNRDTLDNQRGNLRAATPRQNLANCPRPKRGITPGRRAVSRYRGVSPQSSKNTWMAKIGDRGRQVYLGSFTTEEDAARAYNVAAIELYGEFATLNEIPSDD